MCYGSVCGFNQCQGYDSGNRCINPIGAGGNPGRFLNCNYHDRNNPFSAAPVVQAEAVPAVLEAVLEAVPTAVATAVTAMAEAPCPSCSHPVFGGSKFCSNCGVGL